jgi:hypothetical protein
MQVSGAHTWLRSQQVLRCRRCTLTQRLSRIPDSRQMCDALATHMTFVSLIKKLLVHVFWLPEQSQMRHLACWIPNARKVWTSVHASQKVKDLPYMP